MAGQASPAFALLHKRKLIRWTMAMLVGAMIVSACFAAKHLWGEAEASAQDQGQASSPEGFSEESQDSALRGQTPQPMQVVAVVNGQEVGRDELARDCLRRYGKDVIESLINKQLISTYCERNGIRITQEEIDTEMQRVAQRFGVPLDQWLQMLEKERGVTAEQYAEDIIWPTVALRKAAKRALVISPQELQAAYETWYGPAVEARMIVCKSEDKAHTVHAQATREPGEFGRLAKEHSEDVPTARNYGQIMPIRRHLGDEQIERAAFELEEGQVSDVIPAAGQYVIVKCEKHVPSRMENYKLEGSVKEQLERTLREKKERVAATEVFEELRKNARIVKCHGDQENSERYPGVAAIVNNRTITLKELAEECIHRHGVEVLEGTISRVILDQYCQQEKIHVSETDIDEEIARAAEAMGYTDAQGRADIGAWLQNVEMEQGLSLDLYVDEVVWRTVALKQYIHKRRPKAVQITEADLKKGYEASFGPRVRCKAIVVNNQRTADEVWNMAREKPNALYFGQLAAKYSIEPGSQALQGDVPPIQKYGGRPLLEDEAFKLKEGEMSGVIQVDTNYVILFCTGYTEPEAVKYEDVKDEIHRDLYEKKLRVEMAKVYDAMLTASKYENLLAGTYQRPKQADRKVQPVAGEEKRR